MNQFQYTSSIITRDKLDQMAVETFQATDMELNRIIRRLRPRQFSSIEERIGYEMGKDAKCTAGSTEEDLNWLADYINRKNRISVRRAITNPDQF